jgi:hypothetical protein
MDNLTSSNNSVLFSIKPGVYLSASQENPKRVQVQCKTPVLIVERQSENIVVAMLDSKTLVLAHRDCFEEI